MVICKVFAALEKYSIAIPVYQDVLASYCALFCFPCLLSQTLSKPSWIHFLVFHIIHFSEKFDTEAVFSPGPVSNINKFAVEY